MTLEQIIESQEAHGLTETQNRINDGSIWKFEGSVGRNAMALLESGACMLPLVKTYDAYGNMLPSRDMLKDGTKGTIQNSINFWKGVDNGTIVIEDEF